MYKKMKNEKKEKSNPNCIPLILLLGIVIGASIAFIAVHISWHCPIASPVPAADPQPEPEQVPLDSGLIILPTRASKKTQKSICPNGIACCIYESGKEWDGMRCNQAETEDDCDGDTAYYSAAYCTWYTG